MTRKISRKSRTGCLHPAVLVFVYLPFFAFRCICIHLQVKIKNPSASLTLSTSPEWEADIQLPFSTAAILPKNKFFDKMKELIHRFCISSFSFKHIIIRGGLCEIQKILPPQKSCCIRCYMFCYYISDIRSAS